jgi:hypothetical protein
MCASRCNMTCQLNHFIKHAMDVRESSTDARESSTDSVHPCPRAITRAHLCSGDRRTPAATPTRCATLVARHPRQIPFIVGLLATSMFLVPFGLIKRLGLLKTNISSVCKRQISLSTMHAFMMLCRRSIWCLDDVVSKCTLLERKKRLVVFSPHAIHMTDHVISLVLDIR